MEAIEIGACWIDLENGRVIDRFQSFVRRILNPVLTDFCIGLTGIQQSYLTTAPSYREAASLLTEFVHAHAESDSSWASWGNYDRKQFERDSCRHGIPEPIAIPHQNAKRLFAKAERIGKQVGMVKACELAGLILEGDHHPALDDALNIAGLLLWILGKRLLRSG